MKVLVVTNMYPTEREPGFAPFVKEQVDAIRARPEIESVDVQIVDGRSSTLNYFKAIPEVRRRVKQGDYDIVHAHYGLSGAVAMAQRKVPLVVTYHGSDVDNDVPSMRWQRWVSQFVARRAVNITVSKPIQDRLGRESALIPCGISMEAFQPRDRAAARTEMGIPEGATAFLFPSNPKRAEKEYPRFEKVVEVARGRGAEIHPIVFEGFQREQVPTLMAATDVMVMTSSVEGSPVAVMEALATGLPVVSTDVGDVASMLESTDRAYVGEFDAEKFADYAIALGAPNGQRERHAGAERFDMDVIVDRIVDLYLQALAG